VGFELLEDGLRILIWDEAEGEFYEGFCCDDCLGAFSLVAGSDSVDFCGGASPGALGRRIAGFTKGFGGSGDF
jgi:hypothetical protein